MQYFAISYRKLVSLGVQVVFKLKFGKASYNKKNLSGKKIEAPKIGDNHGLERKFRHPIPILASHFSYSKEKR